MSIESIFPHNQEVSLSGLGLNHSAQELNNAVARALPGGEIDASKVSRNLLDDWDFRNPVNQRGQTSYTFSAPGYGIDRWKILSAGAITEISSAERCIILKGISSGIAQPSELMFTENTVVTFSAIYKGTIALTHYGAPFLNVVQTSEDWAVAQYTYTIPAGADLKGYVYAPVFGNGSAPEGSQSTRDLYVRVVKLELGPVSTLSNDPPADYGAELAKCQRYFQNIAISRASGTWIGNDAAVVILSLPVTMRTIPAIEVNTLGVCCTPLQLIGLTDIKVASLSNNLLTLYLTMTGPTAAGNFLVALADANVTLLADL